MKGQVDASVLKAVEEGGTVRLREVLKKLSKSCLDEEAIVSALNRLVADGSVIQVKETFRMPYGEPA